MAVLSICQSLCNIFYYGNTSSLLELSCQQAFSNHCAQSHLQAINPPCNRRSVTSIIGLVAVNKGLHVPICFAIVCLFWRFIVSGPVIHSPLEWSDERAWHDCEDANTWMMLAVHFREFPCWYSLHCSGEEYPGRRIISSLVMQRAFWDAGRRAFCCGVVWGIWHLPVDVF